LTTDWTGPLVLKINRKGWKMEDQNNRVEYKVVLTRGDGAVVSVLTTDPTLISVLINTVANLIGLNGAGIGITTRFQIASNSEQRDHEGVGG